MIKFKDVIKSPDDFKTKVIVPTKGALGDLSWLSAKDTDLFYNNKSLYLFLSNEFNNRFIRWEEDEFMGYFINTFIQYTPMFYSKVANIIEDKLKDLQDNKNVGAKTTISSKSNKRMSDTTYEVDAEHAPNEQDVSIYDMSSYTPNMIENAKRLSQSKINGELKRYLGSFQKLFTQINLDREVEESFTPILQNWLRELTNEVLTYTDRLNAQDKSIADLTKLVNDLYPDKIKPIEDTTYAIGLNSTVDDKGIERQLDDSTPQKIYTKEAIDDKFKGLGGFRGTKATKAELQSITNPVNGDFAHVGSSQPYIEYVYRGDTNVWEETGIAKSHDVSKFGDGVEVSKQKGVAYAISELEEKTITIPAITETTTRVFSNVRDGNLDVSLNGWKPVRIVQLSTGNINSRGFTADVFWGLTNNTTGFLVDITNGHRQTVRLNGVAAEISSGQPALTIGYSVTIEYEKVIPAQSIKVLVKSNVTTA